MAEWRGHQLPSWVAEVRPQQAEAAEQILEMYEQGADVVLVDAPVGTGKTLLAELVRIGLGNPPGSYVANALDLQDQALESFDYARALKGRSNYPTINDAGLTAADCGGQRCMFCTPMSECPYKVAKVEAEKSELAVLNTSYFVTFKKKTFVRPFVVMDEADTLEGILLRHWEYKLSPKFMAEHNLKPPVKGARMTTILKWMQDEVQPVITNLFNEASEELKRSYDPPVPLIRRYSRYKTMAERTGLVVRQLGVLPWVRDYDRNDDTFWLKPVEVSEQGADMIWRRGKREPMRDKEGRMIKEAGKPVFKPPTRWMCMSGTFSDPMEWVESTGLEKSGLRWEIVTVPMQWPVENRPIITKTRANLVFKEMDTEFPKLMDAIIEVCNVHEGENVLVHSVSYGLMKKIVAGLRMAGFRNVISYEGAGDRAIALKRFKAGGGIIVAPSLDRGVDLPDDMCRVQIIAKMPYLNMKDRQVGERLNLPNGNRWFATQTARTLVQSTGRGVRHSQDRCVTYVLDKQFDNWYRKWSKLLPKWWRTAITGDLPGDWFNK